MDIKGGQEQAGCFHNSGFALARAGDQLSLLPHPTVLHTDLGNVSNVDQGPGGFAARERGMGGGPGEQHENTKRQLGMLRSCRASFREGGAVCGGVKRLNCRLRTNKGPFLSLSPCACGNKTPNVALQ